VIFLREQGEQCEFARTLESLGKVGYEGSRFDLPRLGTRPRASLLGEKNDVLNRSVASKSCTELRCALTSALPWSEMNYAHCQAIGIRVVS